jgi:alkylation response protein AidB-like acyl-CoA dehydrogenase
LDFEFTEDQLELRENARSVLAGACPPSLVRSVYDEGADGRALWKQLVDLDWPAIALPEEHGGMGFTFVELGVVVEELGRVTAPGPFLATVTQFAPLVREAGSAEQRARLLAGVVDGTVTGTVALAEGGVWRPDAVRATARRAGDGWVLSGEKSHVLDGATAEEIAVVARVGEGGGEDGLGVFVVPRAAVSARPLAVLDPTLPVAHVSLDGAEVGADRVLGEPGDPAVASAVQRATEEAVTALALSTVATCRAIFERTLQYGKDREQFGRPIGSFQALKHRLADMYLAVERAASVAYFAALTIAEEDARRGEAASMAKAAAGDCQRLLAGDGLQLHGGVGFTWEHDLHFLLKRAKAGDFLFGTAAAHRALLARRLGLVTEAS